MRLTNAICVAALCAASLAVTTQPASATLITSLEEGSVLGMPAVSFENEFQQLAAGVTWSSTVSSSVFGYSGVYGFTSNGLWSGLPMAGLNSATGTMTFAFAAPVDGVGGYLNYVPESGATPSISVYDADMNLLESTTLSFNTGGGWNTGRFFGFQGESDISYFTLSGAFIGITDLTVTRGQLQTIDFPVEEEPLLNAPQALQAAPVPEPSTFALLGAGLLGVCLLRKRGRGASGPPPAATR